jgi:hypothetical protein
MVSLVAAEPQGAQQENRYQRLLARRLCFYGRGLLPGRSALPRSLRGRLRFRSLGGLPIHDGLGDDLSALLELFPVSHANPLPATPITRTGKFPFVLAALLYNDYVLYMI